MAKKKEESEKMNPEESIAALGGTPVTFVMPNTDSLASLDTMNPAYSLNMKYKTQEDWAMLKDQPVRAFYMGMKTLPNENDEAVPCAIFATQKEIFVAAQIILIEACQSLYPNTPVQITYRGKKKNLTDSSASTNLFDVEKLA